jgi:hypothetical protein
LIGSMLHEVKKASTSKLSPDTRSTQLMGCDLVQLFDD